MEPTVTNQEQVEFEGDDEDEYFDGFGRPTVTDEQEAKMETTTSLNDLIPHLLMMEVGRQTRRVRGEMVTTPVLARDCDPFEVEWDALAEKFRAEGVER